MATFIYTLVAAAFLLALFFVIRRFLQSYLKFGGKMIVTCPETQQTVGVEVNRKLAALTSAFGEQTLTLQNCTRWPERQNCGQECLSQIESSPENCMVKLKLNAWFQNKKCVYCGKTFEDIHWHDHKPGLRSPQNELVEWHTIPIATLPEVLQTHQPVCWNCIIAEIFRRDHPDWVTERPWNRGHLV